MVLIPRCARDDRRRTHDTKGRARHGGGSALVEIRSSAVNSLPQREAEVQAQREQQDGGGGFGDEAKAGGGAGQEGPPDVGLPAPAEERIEDGEQRQRLQRLGEV